MPVGKRPLLFRVERPLRGARSAGPADSCGVLALTRLSTCPRVGLRYSLVLDTNAPSPHGQETPRPPDA